MSVPSFRPLPGLANAHLQTLLGNLVGHTAAPPSETWRVGLPDGDAIAAEVSTPPGWSGGLTVVAVHGLAGSHRSGYMIRLARRLYALGIRCARFNLRGSGSGAGLARRPYHGGCSADVRAFLDELWRREPGAHVSLVGYSLGGNIVLKLAAELGDPPAALQQVIAACPAADLNASWKRLSRRRNLLYQHMFVTQLRGLASDKERAFPDLEPARLPRGPISLWTFDDLYTAPRNGFAGVEDYYQRASSIELLGAIQVPTRVLLAMDDPIVASAAFDRAKLSPAISVHRAARGGHLGFLGRGGRVRYMDAQLLTWLLND